MYARLGTNSPQDTSSIEEIWTYTVGRTTLKLQVSRNPYPLQLSLGFRTMPSYPQNPVNYKPPYPPSLQYPSHLISHVGTDSGPFTMLMFACRIFAVSPSVFTRTGLWPSRSFLGTCALNPIRVTLGLH